MNDTNRKLIYLDRNEYSYGIAPLVEQTIREFSPQEFNSYTRCFQQGIKSELSEFIGRMYGVPESNVVLGYGAEDILKSVIHCFLSQGHQQRKILIPTYSWWYYKSIAEEVNGQTIMYPLYEDGYNFKYDIAEIKRIAEKENPDMLLLASPNNPTGNSLSFNEIKDIVSSVGSHTMVALDEAYASYDAGNIDHVATLLKEFPNIISIRTFSKFYGLPGLRLGYAFMGESLKKFGGFSTMYLGYNKLSEKIGIAALQSTDFYREKKALMDEDKEQYKKRLNPLPGFKVYHSDANFVLVKYPEAIRKQLQEAFEKKDLVIKFLNDDGLQSYMRITLGTRQINELVIGTIEETSRNTRIE